MSTKDFQLWVHLHYEDIRNVVLAVVGVVLLVFAVASYNKANKLLIQVKNLSEQNHQLNMQNKDLSKENQEIANRNQRHIDCVAGIFAQYTHDFVPITIQDLDTCTLLTGGSSGTHTAPASSSKPKSQHTTQHPKPSPTLSKWLTDAPVIATQPRASP